MSKIMDKIKGWPRNMGGEIILKSSEDAVFYGALVSDYRIEINTLHYLRRIIYEKIYLEKNKKDPNLHLIANLAVKAQLFREACDEAERHWAHQKTPK